MKKLIIACALIFSFGAAAVAMPVVVSNGPMMQRGYVRPMPPMGYRPQYAPRYAYRPQVVYQPMYYPGPRVSYGYGYGYGGGYGYGYGAPASNGALLALTTLGIVLPTLAILATR